jgi:hypothetical protein
VRVAIALSRLWQVGAGARVGVGAGAGAGELEKELESKLESELELELGVFWSRLSASQPVIAALVVLGGGGGGATGSTRRSKRWSQNRIDDGSDAENKYLKDKAASVDDSKTMLTLRSALTGLWKTALDRENKRLTPPQQQAHSQPQSQARAETARPGKECNQVVTGVDASASASGMLRAVTSACWGLGLVAKGTLLMRAAYWRVK